MVPFVSTVAESIKLEGDAYAFRWAFLPKYFSGASPASVKTYSNPSSTSRDTPCADCGGISIACLGYCLGSVTIVPCPINAFSIT